jgi:hypothetical protein
MKKKMIALLTAASLMATAGIAAADGTIAFYGSSAQAKYWGAQAQTWLGSPSGANCSSTTAAVSSTGGGFIPGTTHYIITGTNCASTNAAAVAGNPGVLTVLYTANDSVTGIQSVAGSKTPNPDGCPAANQRVMYPGTSTANCQTVHVGVSDVKAESITQKSKGYKLGPLDTTGVQLNISYPDATLNTSGLTAIGTPGATLATPFGFYANKAVVATQCTAGLIGSYCAIPTGGTQTDANAQCDTAYGAGNGVCAGGTADAAHATVITNINRLEATLLFTGQVPNWNYLGAYFPSLPVVLCLRHAGSGTHATLDNAVMTAGGTGWGQPLVATQKAGTSHNPTIWFNNASADEMNCINGDTVANPSGSLIGAIGYADADAAPAANVVRLTYNGHYPTRSAMRNGIYDFYAIAWFYTNNSNNANINALASDMVNWASIPANMAASKANYWATAAEMSYIKSSDQAYPGYVGATSPMTP